VRIPFNKPSVTDLELDYISQVYTTDNLAGNGLFNQRCEHWLEKHIGCKKAILTPSCTAALEMAAMLIDIQPGDEVIMPSYTFVSTANAFVLRGGRPVFVDINFDTLNIDETKIDAAITPKTKAIVPVHYAGVGCNMDAIMSIADQYNLYVIEDAAQAILAKYKNQMLGSIGHLATFSFHETKNVTSGEGGALLINSPEFMERADFIRDKGTNRRNFFQGKVDKYSWVDIGSSFLLSEIAAAFLAAQLEKVQKLTLKRRSIWDKYHDAFFYLEKIGRVRRPIISENCQHNAHLYYLLLSDMEERNKLIHYLTALGINAVFHYIPLHTSVAGEKYCRVSGELTNTERLSERLIRLPLWIGLEPYQDQVIQAVFDFFAV